MRVWLLERQRGLVPSSFSKRAFLFFIAVLCSFHSLEILSRLLVFIAFPVRMGAFVVFVPTALSFILEYFGAARGRPGVLVQPGNRTCVGPRDTCAFQLGEVRLGGSGQEGVHRPSCTLCTDSGANATGMDPFHGFLVGE